MANLRHTLAHLFHPRVSNNHRPRILHAEALFALLFIVMFLGASIQLAPYASQRAGFVLGYSSSITASKVVEHTNQQRSALGLSPLSVNEQLSAAAKAKASDMFQDQYWAHFSPQGKSPWDFMRQSGYRYVVAGENLARDFLHTEEMMHAWMNSPTHKENIVNGKYQEIGIAVVDGVLQGVETTLVVQMFGTRGTPPAIAQVDETAVQAAQSEPTSPVALASPNPVAGENEQRNSPDQQVLSQPQATLVPDFTLAQATLSPANRASQQQVLSSSFLQFSELQRPALLSPLHVTKTFFLAIAMLLLTVLVYDTAVIGHRDTIRFVGKNLGHIALFMMVFFIILLFKGGVVL